MPKTRRFPASGTALVVALLLLVGCSGGPDRPPVFPAEGTVTYQGKPVEDAAVSFLGPDGKSKPAVGRTDDKGHFQLTTYDPDDGAIAGRHRVTVEKYATSEDAGGSRNVSMEEALEDPQPAVVPKNVLPARYADAQTTDIEVTVSDSQPNDFEIELKE